MQIWFSILLTVFLIICLFMCGLILIQRGRGGGLAGAFGGAGGNTAFGSKTGDVLTWTTAVVFAVFLLMTIGLNFMSERIHEQRVKPAATVMPLPSNLPSDGPTRAVPADESSSDAAPTDVGSSPSTEPATAPSESTPSN